MTRSFDRYLAISSYGQVLSQALDERDGSTRLHCGRVIELAASLGRQCELSWEELCQLRLCALFHDMGKIGIADRILHKAGRLDEADWVEMRSHPERGQRIVEAIELPGIEEIALGVRHHHEHFDGGGYPDGLAGASIPFISRAVAVVDGYDAMAMRRPYRQPQTHEAIMDVLYQEAGTKYDPDLLSSFAAMMADSAHKTGDAPSH